MPLPLPLVWIFFAHVLAMFPDFLFTAGIAHERWMGVFLGHITTHFVRGPNLTWFAVFLAALAAYLAVLLAYLEPSSHERTGAVRAHLGPGPAARSAASTCWRASPWTDPLARRLCIAMCRLRPLTTAIAACTHGRPAAAHRRHGALHTWASYHRTLERVVLAHRVAHGLRGTAVPIMLLHGESDTTAPVRYVRALAAEVRAVGVRAEMHVVDGDHHLAVRAPAAVATAPAQLLGVPPSSPHQPAADA